MTSPYAPFVTPGMAVFIIFSYSSPGRPNGRSPGLVGSSNQDQPQIAWSTGRNQGHVAIECN